MYDMDSYREAISPGNENGGKNSWVWAEQQLNWHRVWVAEMAACGFEYGHQL
jgi:hypothetical protein